MSALLSRAASMISKSGAADGGLHGRFGPPLPPRVLAGFAVAVLAVALIAFLSYSSLKSRFMMAERVTHTFEVLDQLEALLSTMKDAETGQRGYLLMGTQSYLEPYTNAALALANELKALRSLTADDPQQARRLDTLEQATAERMAELGESIELQRNGDMLGALALMRTDRGKQAMDRIRVLIGEMRSEERRLLASRQQEWQNAADLSLAVSWGGAALLLVLIAAAGVMTSRDYRAQQRQLWIRAGQAGLMSRIEGDQRLDKLGENILEYLAGYLEAHIGAFYVAEGDGRFRRFAGYALPSGAASDVLRPGEGLLGQAAKEKRPLRVRSVPDAYFSVTSSVGHGAPRELLIAPAAIDGVVHGVIELGLFREADSADEELLARASESLGAAVRASKDRTLLESLLEETQRQAEELQTQQEELRVNNEELEEQSRALRESQGRLEIQQSDLEQTNSQLEEQTQLLESQKEELSKAQVRLVEKAAELERSNQYKSEFLSNMSHELRTPLNSSLILAKLLADNKEGTLTAEQVKFAQTIHGAGNDLLALINDILDLSKIEAGKVEVHPEPVLVAALVDALVKAFQPVAAQKQLQFLAQVEPGTPEYIETDGQRLGQILKNLLSNALKFTEAGEVSLRVSPAADGTLSFTVRDTGIGVPAHQQDVIFEAFRQADGSTHRKYGGTGLGLSISRDLARLLGGEIMVRSTPGQGSLFTLLLPMVYAGRKEGQVASAVSMAPTPTPDPADRDQTTTAAPAKPLSAYTAEDDRMHLTPDTRLVLVVEDDVRFALILRDLAHELGFQCVLAQSASEGLQAALTYRPSAILLDINLPDYSGLAVLDQLKRDSQTRHIPVHVVSVGDYTQQALELGAVGFALKPVRREQLVEAFERLEAKLAQGARRVLVVEDDARQRESIRHLLGADDVRITGVASAGDALRELQAATYDCMVIDLNLPDVSGYELLEKMAEQDGVAFPPVIVYTGRPLTRDEELKLRRFAKSIIIKDARSPERLLDEVTLFLHQVESTLPPERQRMLKAARNRDAALDGRRVLVVEDDVRNIFALSSLLEPKGAKVELARNGREAIEALERSSGDRASEIDLILMDIMMPEMDGLTAIREIRKRAQWRKLPIIALTAKAMKDDQERCLAAGANDYIAKPFDVDKLLSLVRVWMPK